LIDNEKLNQRTICGPKCKTQRTMLFPFERISALAPTPENYPYKFLYLNKSHEKHWKL